MRVCLWIWEVSLGLRGVYASRSGGASGFGDLGTTRNYKKQYYTVNFNLLLIYDNKKHNLLLYYWWTKLCLFPFIAGLCLVLLPMPKEIAGSEYIYIQATNFSKIKKDASTVTFANYSLPTIPKEALKHLSQCKILVFINTQTSLIERDAWLGLNNLQSLSIEGSSIRTLDADMFSHLKSLTTLKVTRIITGKLSHHPMSNIPLNCLQRPEFIEKSLAYFA